MADVRTVPREVTAVLASPEGCDAAEAYGAAAVRVSPVEVMVLGPVDRVAIRDAVLPVDDDAVIQDVSDGWVAFALRGPDARTRFARLSELEVPERGFVQGEVAGLPVRVVTEPDRLLLLVPAMVAAHLEGRIREEAEG